MIKNSCCICNTDGFETKYKNVNGHILSRCKKCSLVYLKFLPVKNDFIEDAINDLHKGDKNKVEYWSFPSLYARYKNVFHFFFEDRLAKILKYRTNIESILDIGCGYGFWLEFCRERGFNVFGFDVSPETITWARDNFKLPVVQSTLKDFSSKNNFDVIVMCDVLEHLENPNRELKKVWSILKRNGILYVQVPNLLGIKIPFGHGYGLPHHVWQFNVKTVKALLMKNGFEVLNYYTGTMGVIGVYEKGGPSLMDRIQWEMASTFKIGNRLQIVARKVSE